MAAQPSRPLSGPAPAADPTAVDPPGPARPEPPRLVPAWRRHAARAVRAAPYLRDRLLSVKRGRLPQVSVRAAGWDSVQVSRLRGAARAVLRLDDPDAGYTCSPHTLSVVLPDPAALARLAASGLLSGHVRRLKVSLDTSPEWLAPGAPPALRSHTAEFSWRRHGDGVLLAMSWRRPRDVGGALQDAVAAVLPVRRWEQTGGPVYALDRAGWVAGLSPWPQGRLDVPPPSAGAVDESGRPLGPFQVTPPAVAVDRRPIVTAVVNTHGRALRGAAKPYQLVEISGRLQLRRAAGVAVTFDPAGSPERELLRSRFDKYAVVTAQPRSNADPFAGHVLRLLAACGAVFTAPDAAARAELDELGLVTAGAAEDVADLRGYALSVEAARRAWITGDAALRRTALAGGGVVPLPTVTAIVASKRPDDIETCLGYLAAQTYPELEVVVGAHGYDIEPGRLARWRAVLPRLRVLPSSADETLGGVLGRLSRAAEGELITKLDDDDHYGPHHVTDLVLAWYATGADLVAKGARFVYLPDVDKTIDRGWAAPEAFNVTPAGGTMLLSRGTLQQAGGWSLSSRHVDADLLARVRAAGGVTYRTHGLEYAYVRRSDGHTWAATLEHLMGQARQVYDGLPEELLRPRVSG